MVRFPTPAIAKSIFIPLLAFSASSLADGITTTISGFGTVGGSLTSNQDFAYVHDSSEFSGATNQFDVGLESRLGLQATFNFGSGFSVTAQEVARQRGDKSFDPGTEWLYAQYQPSPDWKLRLGRVALATFLYSDSRLVGYAAPWFRAPNEVYGAEPFFYVDGGEVLWHKDFGQFNLKVQGAYGSTEVNLQAVGISFTSTARDVFNVAVSLEYGNFLVRVAQTGTSSLTSLPLSPNFTLSYNIHDKFTSVGAQYDDGKAILLSEWSKRSENDAPILNEPLSASIQWYLGGGWRFGKLTPFVVYGRAHEEQSLLSPDSSSSSYSGSLRYDVARNVALKAEVTRADAASGYWLTPNQVSHEHINIYSFGVDFVF